MSPVARPTTSVSAIIGDSLDSMYEKLRSRLDGLGDAEYLWEPVEAMWSVRTDPDGVPTVDGAGVRDPDPVPVTTIAWRLWHLASDCFDDYARRFAGDGTEAGSQWTLSADEAVASLDRAWRGYRAAVAGRDWFDELGESWGPWSRHCVADMVMHAGNELVHHAAEIALLRDLYRSSLGPPGAQ